MTLLFVIYDDDITKFKLIQRGHLFNLQQFSLFLQSSNS